MRFVHDCHPKGDHGVLKGLATVCAWCAYSLFGLLQLQSRQHCQVVAPMNVEIDIVVADVELTRHVITAEVARICGADVICVILVGWRVCVSILPGPLQL